MVKSAAFNFMARIVAALLLFLYWIWVSRTLGPADRGICALYVFVVSLIVAISDVAGGATSAYLLQTYAPGRLVQQQMRWSMVPALLVPCFFYLQQQLTLQEAVLLAVMGWVHAAWTMQQHIWLGMGLFRRYNFMVMLFPACLIMVTSMLWYLANWQSRYAVLAALGISWACCFFTGLPFVFRFFNKDDQKSSYIFDFQVFKLGFTNQVGHLLALGNQRLAYLLLPAATLGAYANAQSVSEAALMVSGSLGQVLYARGAAGGVETLPINRLLLLHTCFISVACLLLAWLPEQVWVGLFGAGFSNMDSLMLILSPGLWWYSFFVLLSYWQSAQGRFFVNNYCLLAGLLVQIVWLLYQSFQSELDFSQAALSLTAGWMVVGILALIFFRKYRNSSSKTHRNEQAKI